MVNKLEIKSLGADRAEVVLYGDIGGWGHTAASVKGYLDQITASEVTLRIHSYGGDALEGIAIKNVLRAHPARIVAVVDGTAASAASLIAVAGADELVMGENSELMIHNCWGFADGDSGDLRKAADRLDQVQANYAAAYAAKGGGDPEHWHELMSAETWFSAEEAVQIGLADRVAVTVGESADIAASGRSRVFAKFKYSGRRASPAPSLIAPLGQEGKSMDFMDSVAQRLGVSADADEKTVLAALDETLAEQANEAGTITIPVKPDLSAFTKDEIVNMLSSLNVDVENTDADGDEPADDESDVDTGDSESTESTDDSVLIDKDVYEDLLKRAARGDQAAEASKKQKAEELVAAAITDGKVLAAKRDALIAAAVDDFDGMKAHFAKLASGTIPVVEMGRGGSDEARGAFDIENRDIKNKQAEVKHLFQAPTI